jgi:O-antigen/teichoic acid export membrane protein
MSRPDQASSTTGLVTMITKMITKIKKHLSEPLFKNAYFLMGRAAATSLLGVVFWILVARFYSPSEVGLATVLISTIGLLGITSKLGFGFGLVRYLPQERDKRGMINSCLTIAGLFALLLAIIFVAGLNFWSPALLFIQKDLTILLLFIIFTLIYCLSLLQDSVFLGMRSAKFSFIQSIIIGTLKIPLPLALVSFGMLGIFSSWGLAICVALMVSFFLFMPRVVLRYYPVPIIEKKVISKMAHFSAGNYVADIFDSTPILVLPLVIVNVLSEEMSAYFYMAWAIASMLNVIPVCITSSLLAEGSHEPNRFRKNVIVAIKFSLILLIPAIVVIFVIGDKLLLLFGSEYSEHGLALLWMLVLSTIPLAITRVYGIIKRMQLKMLPIIAIAVFTAVGSLGGSYILMVKVGLLGIGIAWLSVQGVMAAVVGWLVIRREKWIVAQGQE